MSEPTDPNASFALRRDPKRLDLNGPVTQVQSHLRGLTTPAQRAGWIRSIVSGVALLAGLVAAVFHYVIALDVVGWIPQGEAPGWLLPVALGLFAVGVLVPWLARSRPQARLDTRKQGLVEALLAYLEREVPPTTPVTLYVDFGPARPPRRPAALARELRLERPRAAGLRTHRP